MFPIYSMEKPELRVLINISGFEKHSEGQREGIVFRDEIIYFLK